jgi:hypothetical protein
VIETVVGVSTAIQQQGDDTESPFAARRDQSTLILEKFHHKKSCSTKQSTAKMKNLCLDMMSLDSNPSPMDQVNVTVPRFSI